MSSIPKVLLLDGDGVIWIDNTPIKGAIDALNRIRKLGVRLVLVTNNCSKTREQYLKMLEKLGLEGFQVDDVFSSGYATAKYLQHHNISKVHVCGFDGLMEELTNHGIEVHSLKTDPEPQPVQAVVVSKSETLSHADISRGILLCKNYGAKLIGTNPDPNFPMHGGILICGSGSCVRAFEVGTNQVADVIGKPNKPMFDTVLLTLGVTKDDVVMVGDRMITDILFASRNGARSVLVLSGIDTEKDIQDFPEADHPTWVKPSLVELADMFEEMAKQK